MVEFDNEIERIDEIIKKMYDEEWFIERKMLNETRHSIIEEIEKFNEGRHSVDFEEDLEIIFKSKGYQKTLRSKVAEEDCEFMKNVMIQSESVKSMKCPYAELIEAVKEQHDIKVNEPLAIDHWSEEQVEKACKMAIDKNKWITDIHAFDQLMLLSGRTNVSGPEGSPLGIMGIGYENVDELKSSQIDEGKKMKIHQEIRNAQKTLEDAQKFLDKLNLEVNNE